jgi:hypothetical protein
MLNKGGDITMNIKVEKVEQNGWHIRTRT